MKYQEKEKQQFVERYQKGESAISICSQADIPKSTFYLWVNKYRQIVSPGSIAISGSNFARLKQKLEKQENIIAVLKAVNCNPNSPTQEKLQALEALHGQYSIHVLCDALNVPRGTFYNHILRNKRENKSVRLRREKLKILIKEVFEENRQIYGAEKISSVLREQGHIVSRKIVSELM